MVMAKIDRKPFPRPPLPPCVPTPPKPQIDMDGIKDGIEFFVKDKNHDGGLDHQEFNAGRSKFDQLVNADKFDHYDGDKNGKIDGKEYHAGKEKERFHKALSGQLDLPKWDKKVGGAIGGVAAEAGSQLKDAVTDVGAKVQDAIGDIF